MGLRGYLTKEYEDERLKELARKRAARLNPNFDAEFQHEATREPDDSGLTPRIAEMEIDSQGVITPERNKRGREGISPNERVRKAPAYADGPQRALPAPATPGGGREHLTEETKAIIDPSVSASTLNTGRPGDRKGHSEQSTAVQRKRPSFPFETVCNAIQTYAASFSVNNPQQECNTEIQQVFTCRMNTYVDFLTGTTLNNQTSHTAPGVALSPQNTGRYAMPNNVGEATMYNNFRHRLIHNYQGMMETGTAAVTMKDWYNKLYEAYHVVNTKWQMTLRYPVNIWSYQDQDLVQGNTPTQYQVQYQDNYGHYIEPNQYITVFVGYHITGDSIAATDNVPTTGKVESLEQHDQWFQIVNIRPGETKTISGTWYPGMIRHKTKNDDDVAVWSTINQVPTSNHLEMLKVAFYRGKNCESYIPAHNVQVDFKLAYEIQYRDLQHYVHFPYLETVNLTIDPQNMQRQYGPDLT